METPFAIVPVKSAQATELSDLARQTFSDTFSSLNSEENMRKYLDEELSQSKLEVEIDTPGSEFYFIYRSNQMVGYLKVNFGNAQTVSYGDGSLEIERIYIQKEHHGTGAAKALLDWAIGIAREREAEYLWLGVWEKNPRAIRFYSKYGFKAFGSHVFKLGDDEQTDILMKRQLP